jgi:uncharacterized protein (DUF433 family)
VTLSDPCAKVQRVDTVVELLERPLMAVPEAARQLAIPASTLKDWLNGRGHHPPVLRDSVSETASVTWGEMVEALYLRRYRRQGVSLQRLRPFIQAARVQFGIRYPLATLRPFVGDGRRLLLELQEQFGLPEDLRVVYELRTGQLELDYRAQSYLEQVVFDDDTKVATQIRHGELVVNDPQVSSGAATVRGIRTEVILEALDTGAHPREIAQDYGLPIRYVIAALEHELSAA